eukprot:TRINITY_DN23292_c0_g1_i1.p1 TRINITY_DN23292_c0_g1~~TRINITY_DN23292_c0_g1_i1.p1  ORF type:complete len:457 (+),score=58.43 TRINITY_DN23292_c0_g1_i1:43-1371(+)
MTAGNVQRLQLGPALRQPGRCRTAKELDGCYQQYSPAFASDGRTCQRALTGDGERVSSSVTIAPSSRSSSRTLSPATSATTLAEFPKASTDHQWTRTSHKLNIHTSPYAFMPEHCDSQPSSSYRRRSCERRSWPFAFEPTKRASMPASEVELLARQMFEQSEDRRVVQQNEREMAREHQRLKELEDCTFRPRTNVGGNGGEVDSIAAGCFLYERGRRSGEKMHEKAVEMRRRREEDEMSQCTFRPELISRCVHRNKESNSPFGKDEHIMTSVDGQETGWNEAAAPTQSSFGPRSPTEKNVLDQLAAWKSQQPSMLVSSGSVGEFDADAKRNFMLEVSRAVHLPLSQLVPFRPIFNCSQSPVLSAKSPEPSTRGMSTRCTPNCQNEGTLTKTQASGDRVVHSSAPPSPVRLDPVASTVQDVTSVRSHEEQVFSLLAEWRGSPY